MTLVLGSLMRRCFFIDILPDRIYWNVHVIYCQLLRRIALGERSSEINDGDGCQLFGLTSLLSTDEDSNALFGVILGDINVPTTPNDYTKALKDTRLSIGDCS